jgi:hypothetical protein
MDSCELERCKREIAGIEAVILAGNPDLQGLCLALSDWSAELRILQEEAKENAARSLQKIAPTGGGGRRRT